ncbi:MAG: hypothetical protein HUU16_21370 [Candidatus Omnitrophica bacterium]|nr:hypothetical protein [bacterium]NUN98714.1 hypothetical protein [Candidatus Omnitrophota bacterium]
MEPAAPHFLIFPDDNPLLPLDDNCIAHPDRSIGRHIGPEPSAILERGQDLLPGEFLKARASATEMGRSEDRSEMKMPMTLPGVMGMWFTLSAERVCLKPAFMPN